MEFLLDIKMLGMAVILITHDMHLMQEYTPRAILLAWGRKTADSLGSAVITKWQVIE